MPIYEYECANAHRHEVIRSFDRRDEPWGCLTCASPMTRVWSASHVPPDGVYSYAPNVGDPERFDRQRQAIQSGQKVIPRGGTRMEKEAMERSAEAAHKRRRR